jgi:hypothetical protein
MCKVCLACLAYPLGRQNLHDADQLASYLNDVCTTVNPGAAWFQPSDT